MGVKYLVDDDRYAAVRRLALLDVWYLDKMD